MSMSQSIPCIIKSIQLFKVHEQSKSNKTEKVFIFTFFWQKYWSRSKLISDSQPFWLTEQTLFEAHLKENQSVRGAFV